MLTVLGDYFASPRIAYERSRYLAASKSIGTCQSKFSSHHLANPVFLKMVLLDAMRELSFVAY